MTAVISSPGSVEKLDILSRDGQYDLACACGTGKDEHRRRGAEGRWIYPVTLPNGGTSILFKTLMSNVCTSDCKYCPLRKGMDIRRCSLGVEETANTFLDYYRRREVFGLFLSSGLADSADATMERLIGVAGILRKKHRFRGYIHLKIIPGSSESAIEEAVSLSSAVSLNIETPGERNLARLSGRKQYIRDIIEPMKVISRLTGKGGRYEGVKQTTQFIVGAAGEPDKDIVRYMWGLYDRLKMHRVYFSAYQRGLGTADLPGENAQSGPFELFTREHRLYQVDFLMRKYGFKDSDIIFDDAGQLSLDCDPKAVWANNHPEFFPVNINRADKFDILRVPGLGPTIAGRIIKLRRLGRITGLEMAGVRGKLADKASRYVAF